MQLCPCSQSLHSDGYNRAVYGERPTRTAAYYSVATSADGTVVHYAVEVTSSGLATDGHMTSAKCDPCTAVTSSCSSDQTFEDCLLLAHSELCRSVPTSGAQIALALTAWQQHKKDLSSLALA
jgi:hypothetical protein